MLITSKQPQRRIATQRASQGSASSDARRPQSSGDESAPVEKRPRHTHTAHTRTHTYIHNAVSPVPYQQRAVRRKKEKERERERERERENRNRQKAKTFCASAVRLILLPLPLSPSRSRPFLLSRSAAVHMRAACLALAQRRTAQRRQGRCEGGKRENAARGGAQAKKVKFPPLLRFLPALFPLSASAAVRGRRRAVRRECEGAPPPSGVRRGGGGGGGESAGGRRRQGGTTDIGVGGFDVVDELGQLRQAEILIHVHGALLCVCVCACVCVCVCAAGVFSRVRRKRASGENEETEAETTGEERYAALAYDFPWRIWPTMHYLGRCHSALPPCGLFSFSPFLPPFLPSLPPVLRACVFAAL